MGSHGYMCSTCMEADESISHLFMDSCAVCVTGSRVTGNMYQICHGQSKLHVQYDNHYVMGSHGNMCSKYDVQWPVNLIEGVSYLSP